eukprot:scaffold57144_cov66-Phaeocystis_antarctica.AAC.9
MPAPSAACGVFTAVEEVSGSGVEWLRVRARGRRAELERLARGEADTHGDFHPFSRVRFASFRGGAAAADISVLRRELGGGPVNLAGARSAQPVPASPRPPHATHRPAAARAPRTTDAGAAHAPAATPLRGKNE